MYTVLNKFIPYHNTCNRIEKYMFVLTWDYALHACIIVTYRRKTRSWLTLSWIRHLKLSKIQT